MASAFASSDGAVVCGGGAVAGLVGGAVVGGATVVGAAVAGIVTTAVVGAAEEAGAVEVAGRAALVTEPDSA